MDSEKGVSQSKKKKNGVKEHISTKSVLQDMLKGMLSEDEEKERGTQEQRGKMAMNKCLSIITLNVNGLNAAIKDIE